MPKEPEAREITVDEVLPPGAPDPARPEEKKGPRLALRIALPRLIAYYLDEFKTVPGTKFKIGLDPIVGFLFPVVGDATSASLGSLIMLEGARRGVPKNVLIRMGTNIALNAAVGSIPVLGDLFSLWFKSNAQNYALLQKHGGDPAHPLVKPKTWPILVFLAAVFAIIALMVVGLIWLVKLIW